MERRGTERSSRSRDDDDRPSRRRDEDDAPRSSRRGRDDDDDRGSRRGGGGRSSSGFTYQQRSRESVDKRSNQGASDFDVYIKDGVKMFKVADGGNNIRILPPTWDNPEHFGHDIYVHYSIGPDRQTYLCLHKMKGEDCPICEEHKRAKAAGEEEYAKELQPTKRVLYYLVDRNNEKDGVQAWPAPWTFDRDLVKISVDKRSGEVLPIDHPEEGYDIDFDKTGKNQNTKYIGLSIARRDSELGNNKWLDFAVENPLPEQLVYYSYEHIAKAFGGGGAHREKSRGRDDDAPKARRNRDDDEDDTRSKSRGRDDDRPSRRRDEDELTWDGVHSMSGAELDALVEDRGLKIKPSEAADDEELADWICEDLGIVKERKRHKADDEDDDSPRAKLRRMREEREGR